MIGCVENADYKIAVMSLGILVFMLFTYIDFFSFGVHFIEIFSISSKYCTCSFHDLA